ncbi:Spx/MgsR family RNA polymerase-binding regulatory protein [Pseudahrensia aquimaris]|uniref:Spx/MgsR family RNA polymerase-binding regulatory protein n=1 Tax=Pseudahrensia aquimaris TaxID=744461 RepID=A0ABW3FEF8_9HYPH
MIVYTLKSCDTCKKALKWLDAEGIAYENRDVRADGISPDTIRTIVSSLGWEKALNRRSTTWRNLPQSQKDALDAEKAIALIEDNATIMKRPVFVTEHEIMGGFDDSVRDWLKS